jgi:uncharacterized caspase-like protein
MRGTSRRRFVIGLSATPVAQAMPWLAWAAAVAAGAPRIALAVGNNRYQQLPPLKNAARDASALGEQLVSAGFAVTARIDAPKKALEASITQFCADLQARKGVGLFYFAGHGLQLEWRNYLVPVDAQIRGADDVRTGATDLAVLLEGLAKASNPLNIVILDACRDNPFAVEGGTGRGLSQMDAPVGTFLAYATAPGNTASDGEGDNGLYTEHLLREMRAPDAKIEDVFKRVRLGVRRASGGRQIPWESTSLEEDFYFVAQAGPKRPTKEEIDRRYADELAAWQQVEAKATAAARNLPTSREGRR